MSHQVISNNSPINQIKQAIIINSKSEKSIKKPFSQFISLAKERLSVFCNQRLATSPSGGTQSLLQETVQSVRTPKSQLSTYKDQEDIFQPQQQKQQEYQQKEEEENQIQNEKIKQNQKIGQKQLSINIETPYKNNNNNNNNNNVIKFQKNIMSTTNINSSNKLLFSNNNTPSKTKIKNSESLSLLLLTPLPNHEPTKCSVKKNGFVKAYAANTNQGLVRNYNEDRVSIILNIIKPTTRTNELWPKCSFFGVYDGHGGSACADFLRDNLHQYVIRESSFPQNPKEAIKLGFENAERDFINQALNSKGMIDGSGSCAIVVLIVGDICYVANVGDSRAVLSSNNGKNVYPLSQDHKPTDEQEQKRILEAGGKIYQSQSPLTSILKNNTKKSSSQLIMGPHRVYPGRLSVSRTFGDVQAKHPKFCGNPKVVIAEPDIKIFRMTKEQDFIIIASDGVFDKLNSTEVVECVWESTKQQSMQNIHKQCGIAVESILRQAISRRTLDNITAVMIAFENFRRNQFPQDSEDSTTDKTIKQQINEEKVSDQIKKEDEQKKQEKQENRSFLNEKFEIKSEVLSSLSLSSTKERYKAFREQSDTSERLGQSNSKSLEKKQSASDFQNFFKKENSMKQLQKRGEHFTDKNLRNSILNYLNENKLETSLFLEKNIHYKNKTKLHSSSQPLKQYLTQSTSDNVNKLIQMQTVLY